MQMTAKYCSNCDHILHADKYHCPICYTDELELMELSGYGEVYSYTKIHAAPKSLAHLAPYFIILVDLAEGLRVTARYQGEDLEIGKRVQLKEVDGRAYVFGDV
ncbi:Zn-ribbon domain-containing OB-fold protein [Virgibacillus alimentarius]|uniref:Zn-ribbon domain-containing OB-fold protein n=1 Tax=Virgibacillus alimentarius TaxID=698769 RepID=UPI000691615F|nr:OB-fold domain-containing protein [Virgibacillus alimentarius]